MERKQLLGLKASLSPLNEDCAFEPKKVRMLKLPLVNSPIHEFPWRQESSFSFLRSRRSTGILYETWRDTKVLPIQV